MFNPSIINLAWPRADLKAIPGLMSRAPTSNDWRDIHGAIRRKARKPLFSTVS